MSNKKTLGTPQYPGGAVQPAETRTVVRLLLKGEEVAGLLGISRALAYRWMAAGILPVIRVPGGRTRRVPREALVKWIQDNTRSDSSTPGAPPLSQNQCAGSVLLTSGPTMAQGSKDRQQF